MEREFIELAIRSHWAGQHDDDDDDDDDDELSAIVSDAS